MLRPSSFISRICLTITFIIPVFLIAAVGTAGRGAAQEPAPAWAGMVQLQSDSQAQGASFTLVLRLTPDPDVDGNFFDVSPYTEVLNFFDVLFGVELIDPSGEPLVLDGFRFQGRAPGAETDFDFTVSCPVDCLAGATEPNFISIGFDGFPFTSVQQLRDAAEAGALVVVAQTSFIHLEGTFEFGGQEGEELVATIDVPAGLSLVGWCGAPTTSETLFERHPELEAIYRIDGVTGGFISTDRGLPVNLRQDVPLGFMSAFFVRAASPFLLEIAGVAGPGDAPENLVLNLSLGWDLKLTAGTHMVANCGDARTNRQIVEANPDLDRLFAFDDGAKRWITTARTPSGLVIQNEGWDVASNSGFVVAAEAAFTLSMPCASPSCQAAFQDISQSLGSG